MVCEVIAAQSYQDAPVGSEAAKSMQRAEMLKPRVIHLHTDLLDRESYYLVKRTDKISKHITRVWIDPDGMIFIECPCYRGLPPIDSKTKLPAFEPMHCMHAAGTLLYIAEEHSEGASNVIPIDQRRTNVSK